MTEWIGGRRPVAEALAAGRPAHRLLVSSTAKPAPELRTITDAARRIHLPVDHVARVLQWYWRKLRSKSGLG